MSNALPDRQPRQINCAYCGAPLRPGYYFCLSCATPHQNVESVLPRSRPAYLSDGILIDKKAPHVKPVFWTYFAVVIGSAILSYFLFEEKRVQFALLFQSVALFVTTAIFAALHWPALSVQFKRIGFLSPYAWVALAALVPLLAINYGYHSWIVRQMGLDRSWPLHGLRDSEFGRPAILFFFCVFPAVIEETAFRGLVQHWLQIAISPMKALVLASALFTILHFTVISAPYLFAVGMLLGWARLKTGSLYPSMLIHFLHNYAALALFN